MSINETELVNLLEKGLSRSDIAKQLNVTKAAISWYCKNKLKLDRANLEEWLNEEITVLIDNYPYYTANNLCKLIPRRSADSIRRKAHELGIKKHKIVRKVKQKSHRDPKLHSITRLLDNSCTSLYYLGLILSDGSVRPERGTIRLKLSTKDESLVLSFKNFIKSDNKLNYSTTKSRELDGHILPESLSVSLEVRDINSINMLCKRFDIRAAKTYNPPEALEGYEMLNLDQKLCFLVGFIDGDGSIKKRKDRKNLYQISIRCHKNWENFWRKFKNFIEKDTSEEFGKIKLINNTSLIGLHLYKKDHIKILKEVIEKYNLPVLERKWGKVVTD